jgi:two-component system LytT family sensor kinase
MIKAFNLRINTYWICQLLGWFGMVAIETINYTFFIAGKFSISLFWTFVSFALVGIFCTHIFRLIIKRKRFFEQKKLRIWIVAFVSTLVISAIICIVNFLPSAIQNFQFFIKNVTIIDVVGMLINWSRYVGVWVIIYFMYKILQQNSAIQSEKLLVENLAKTTELELLKLQLNPHFLFNALNSIKALVVINPEQSRDAIVKLSELLRFTLQYGKERLIPLNDELQEVRKYLELEQMRFGSRLHIVYTIDDNTLSQTIPPATILTLAENAIKHGIAKQIGDATIEINTHFEADELAVTVTNTGYYEPNKGTGIGLKHITRRLEEVFNGTAIFTIEQQNNIVVATLKVPTSWQ